MNFYLTSLLAFLACTVYASFFEWTLHRFLMHTPLWQYPFRAHAVVHHGLFRTGDKYFLTDVEILPKVRFAWWNAPFIIGMHIPAILLIQMWIGAPILLGAVLALSVYYGLYEYLHYCMHVPLGRAFEHTQWFHWLDSHHHMHHKRHFNNLNVVLPLADLLFGTLIPTREHIPLPDRVVGAQQVGLLFSES